MDKAAYEALKYRQEDAFKWLISAGVLTGLFLIIIWLLFMWNRRNNEWTALEEDEADPPELTHRQRQSTEFEQVKISPDEGLEMGTVSPMHETSG